MTRKKKVKIVPILIKSVIAALIVFYLGMAVYFIGHFSFNSYVNDEEAFGKDAAALCQEVVDTSSRYSITIHGRNNASGVITSAQISLKPEFDKEFDEILAKQNAFLWPVYLFTESRYTTDTVVSYSKEQLQTVIQGMDFFKSEYIEEPVDAHISDNSGENGFEVVPEKAGSMPSMVGMLAEIEGAINILQDECTLTDLSYESAEIKADDPTLNELCANLNKYCSVNLVYDFGENQEIVNGDRVKEWCSINGTEVTLDEERVKDFVSYLARTYDSFGKTRTIKTVSGSDIEVKGGDYGWWMDRATETKELTAAIKNGEKGTRKPVYFQEAKSYGENDYGDSYVEINLTKQHLWVYKEGKVVEESDFVSGCVNKKRVTPTGTYSITYKERDATLVGQGYSSPVSYWMPFNGNVGMHDASWRSSFGGDIYVTNGSHGCVNLPKKKAEAIYEIVEKGYPIIVYGGKTEPEPVEPTPQEQLQQLIDAGLLNPDGTIPSGSDVVNQEQIQEQ